MTALPSPLRLLERWAVGSQRQARHNAMTASSVLAERRAEATDVAEFLASLPDPTVAHG